MSTQTRIPCVQAHRYREIREPGAELAALAEGRDLEVCEELGEAAEAHAAERVQAVLELVLLALAAAREEVVPPGLLRGERGVGGEREEGVFVEGALDERGQRGQRGVEEGDEREQERAEGRRYQCLSRQRGQLYQQAVLLLHGTSGTQHRDRERDVTSTTFSRFPTHLPSSLPASTPSIVSARSTTLRPWSSKHFFAQFPRMSAYPRWASFRVARIAGAAWCEGWVVGRLRRKATSGWRVARRRRGGVQSVEHGLLARLDLDAARADGRERVDPPLHERLAVDIGRRTARANDGNVLRRAHGVPVLERDGARGGHGPAGTRARDKRVKRDAGGAEGEVV